VGASFGAGEWGGEASEKKPKKPRAAKKPGKRRFGLRSGRFVWELLHVHGLLRSVARLVAGVLRSIRVRRLWAAFRVDLGDPADTAVLVGPLSQAALLTGIWSPCSFRLLPAFDGVLLEGDAGLAARLRPVSLVPPLLGFVLSPSTLKAVIVVVRSRWKKDA